MDTEDREHFKRLAVISSRPNVVSLPNLQNSTNQQEQTNYAAERALLMFGCYRKGDANDPETYTMAITAILRKFPIDVIKRVTDPADGIPSKFKWMPNPAEVREECEAAEKTLGAIETVKIMGWRWNGAKWISPEDQ